MSEATPIKPPAPPASRLRPWVEIIAAVGFAVLSACLARYGIYIPPHVPEQQPPQQQPQPQPPVPPKSDPLARPDPVAAIGRITFGRAGCTATVIGPQRADGRWDVLTAWHCVRNQPTRGVMVMPDGRRFGVSVVAADADADCCWLVTDDPHPSLPFALLAAQSPGVGVSVWHQGYGIDKPGNRERGRVLSGPDADGQLAFMLSMSSGDSGGAIVREDTGEVVSCVCCTEVLAQPARMYGASVEVIHRARQRAASGDDWIPMPIPVRPATIPDVLPEPPSPRSTTVGGVRGEKRTHRIAQERRTRCRVGDRTAGN